MRLSSSLLVPPEAPGSCAEAGPFQAVQKADLLRVRLAQVLELPLDRLAPLFPFAHCPQVLQELDSRVVLTRPPGVDRSHLLSGLVLLQRQGRKVLLTAAAWARARRAGSCARR